MDEPYDGTRGHSGSSTSEDAAYADLVNGVTSVIDRLVLILAANAGARGVTVAEIREKDGTLHHGRVSSALTRQHIAGRLVALYERRKHSGVYVLPEYQNERPARAYHRRGRKPIDPEVIEGVLLSHQFLTPPGGLTVCRCGWMPDETRITERQRREHLAKEIAEALR